MRYVTPMGHVGIAVCLHPSIIASTSWFITPITMVYGTYNYSIHGVYKPTNITGGPHIVAPKAT